MRIPGVRVDEIKTGILFDGQRDIDKCRHVHPKIRRPFNPAAIHTTQYRRAGEEQLISIFQPLGGFGNFTIYGDAGLKKIMQDMLPYMAAQYFYLDFVSPADRKCTRLNSSH